MNFANILNGTALVLETLDIGKLKYWNKDRNWAIKKK